MWRQSVRDYLFTVVLECVFSGVVINYYDLRAVRYTVPMETVVAITA